MIGAVYGMLASALIVGAAATLLPLPRRQGVGWVVAGLALVTFAPFVHGALATPSFTLAQCALLRLLAPQRPLLPGRLPAALLVAWAAVFYPLALGLGPWDPFDLGYRPLPLLLALLPLGLWLAWRKEQLWLVVIGCNLLAYAAGLFDNFWNACCDPLLVILAALRLLRSPQRETASPIN